MAMQFSCERGQSMVIKGGVCTRECVCAFRRKREQEVREQYIKAGGCIREWRYVYFGAGGQSTAEECTWMCQSVHIKAGGRSTVEECMWMHKRVYMCDIQSRRSDHRDRGQVDAPGTVHICILEQEVGAQ
jgi:hypothetical protein